MMPYPLSQSEPAVALGSAGYVAILALVYQWLVRPPVWPARSAISTALGGADRSSDISVVVAAGVRIFGAAQGVVPGSAQILACPKLIVGPDGMVPATG